MRLRAILVAEGQTKTTTGLAQDLLDAIKAIGYVDGFYMVVNDYKPAAGERELVNGVNICAASVGAFRVFASASAANAEHAPPLIQALLFHNAASALSRGNGNQPDRQARLNRQALAILENVRTDPNDDWWVVYEKVVCGLMEAQHIPFDETVYRKVMDSMSQNASKDTAGRRAFLAEWLVKQGRSADAVSVLERITGDTFSASNQWKRASELLAHLTTTQPVVVTKDVVFNRGTSRERQTTVRRGKVGKSGETNDGGSESHIRIRRRVWCNAASGMFFSSTRRDNVVAPTHDLLQKGIKLLVLFCLFFLFKSGILFVL